MGIALWAPIKEAASSLVRGCPLYRGESFSGVRAIKYSTQEAREVTVSVQEGLRPSKVICIQFFKQDINLKI